MIIKTVIGAALAALTLAATAAPAATYTVAYEGTNLIGPAPLARATLVLTTEDMLNPFGGYFITGISGDVDGDAVTGLLPFEGPATCDCFPEGYAAFGGFFSISNTLYLTDAGLNLGQLFDHGGLGFQSATNVYNLWGAGDGAYAMFGMPSDTIIDPQSPDLPDGASISVGIAAVPEPASWAMMIAGFGAIGSTLRRTRRSTLAHA